MSVTAFFTFAAATLRQWRRNHQERQELASCSVYERYQLSFVGDADAELAKPFWRKWP